MKRNRYLKGSLTNRDNSNSFIMRKSALFLVFCIIPLIAYSQHTFSIVAVDSLTGEIGSAGATCGDSIIWPGTPGAKIISDVIPGIGAIHTQAYHNYTNQAHAHDRMIAGDSPQEIINWLIMNDVSGNPSIRQYGIVDFNGGHPRSAGYTGNNCNNYKNHITGRNYAIQGNILLGPQILDSMEARFLNTPPPLSDKIMAAMQGAKVVGADTRCTGEGTSSLSAFIRVAKPNDIPNMFYLDINIAGTPTGVEPIDILQNAYDIWKMTSGYSEKTENDGFHADIFPNPTDGKIMIVFGKLPPEEIKLISLLGETLFTANTSSKESVTIDMRHYSNGLYFLICRNGNRNIVRKISLKK